MTLKQLILDLNFGMAFHPDTPIRDYMFTTETQESVIARYEEALDKAWGEFGNDIYDESIKILCDNEDYLRARDNFIQVTYKTEILCL